MRALVDEHSKRADDAGKLARCLGEVLDQLDTITAELAAEKDRADAAESALETEQAKVKGLEAHLSPIERADVDGTADPSRSAVDRMLLRAFNQGVRTTAELRAAEHMLEIVGKHRDTEEARANAAEALAREACDLLRNVQVLPIQNGERAIWFHHINGAMGHDAKATSPVKSRDALGIWAASVERVLAQLRPVTTEGK